VKTLTNLFRQDRERFIVPKSVQDVIPIKAIWDDGVFMVGNAGNSARGGKYAKTFRFGQMQATGIMGGVGNNTFAPKDPYTREQSIITIMRLYDVVK
jgi:hypothetical protein